jgi:hypothetical protein
MVTTEDDMNATFEGSGALSHIDLSLPRSRGIVIGFWTVTALFCLQIGFTAYAQLSLPQVAEAFTRLGFPGLLPGGARVGQAPWHRAAACASAGAAQGVGVRRLRHHPRLGADCARVDRRRPGGVGLGRGYRCAVGTLVLLLEAGAIRGGERVVAAQWPTA